MHEIPKIIHQVHLGTKPIDEQTQVWINTWKRYNPDWKQIMWNDAKIASLSLQNKEQFDKCCNFSEKSDILRFEILCQFGGLYIDTDFECLKNIDLLFNQISNDPIMFLETNDTIGSAFIAATPQNYYIKKLVDNVPEREKNFGKQPSNVKYGPVYITELLGLNKALPDGLNCSKKTVYPYAWWERNRRTEDFRATHPEAYAVHHWSGSWK